MDRHTRVRYERNPGFLERIGGSLAGILVGIVLIVAGCVLLFWNEVQDLFCNKNRVIPLPKLHINLLHCLGRGDTQRIDLSAKAHHD